MRRFFSFTSLTLALGAVGSGCFLSTGPFDADGGSGGTGAGNTGGGGTAGTGGTGGMAECGNGKVEAGEACDDGDAEGDDGCTASCVIEPGWACANEPDEPSVCAQTCHDGKLDTGEECDVGPDVTGDGCAADCKTEPGWECSQPSGNGAPSVCVPDCGDGTIVNMREVCDDGNEIDGDGCAADCSAFEPGWNCGNEPTICAEICGDGLAVGVESCDDGNGASGDGCSMVCAVEKLCNNGIVDPGEPCDGGPGCTLCALDPASTCGKAIPLAPSPDNVDLATGAITTYYENPNSLDVDVPPGEVLPPPCGSVNSPVLHRYTVGKRPARVTVESMEYLENNSTKTFNSNVWIYRDCPNRLDLDACDHDTGQGNRGLATTGFVPAGTTLFMVIDGDGPNDKGPYRLRIEEQPVRLFHYQNFGKAAAPGLDDMLGGLTSTSVGAADTVKWQRCTPGNASCAPVMASHSGGAFAYATDGDNMSLTNTLLESADVDTALAPAKLYLQMDVRTTDIGGANEFGKVETSAAAAGPWTTLATYMNTNFTARAVLEPAPSAKLRFKLTWNDAGKDVDPFSVDDIHVYGY